MCEPNPFVSFISKSCGPSSGISLPGGREGAPHPATAFTASYCTYPMKPLISSWWTKIQNIPVGWSQERVITLFPAQSQVRKMRLSSHKMLSQANSPASLLPQSLPRLHSIHSSHRNLGSSTLRGHAAIKTPNRSISVTLFKAAQI